MPLRKKLTVDDSMLVRRLALGTIMAGLIACAIFVIGPKFTTEASAVGEERTLSLFNTHTSETITVTYKRDGRYIPSAMAELNRFLGDWRRNTETRMDPELIDLVWELSQELGVSEPIQIISGYRSQETNDMLRRQGRKVARRSQHITGKAMDVYFPGVPLEQLRNSALVREVGGVGYYPRSGQHGFVHVDTGNVRHWPRLGQQQLANIFREHREQSQHEPREERTPVYLAENNSNADQNLAQGRSPENQDFPLPLDKPTLVAAVEPQPAPADEAPATVVASLTPPPGSENREPATQIESASEADAAPVQAVNFALLASLDDGQPAADPNRNLMFFPLAIMRHDETAAPAIARNAAYQPQQPTAAYQEQVVAMRGSVTELSDEDMALIAGIVDEAPAPRQFTSSEVSRIGRQIVDRNGKGPLLMSSHAQPLSVADERGGRLNAPETIIDLINGSEDVAAVPENLDAPTTRLGLEDAVNAPGDAAGEQPVSIMAVTAFQ
jgi:uncharacterized protein YcbK (DUF882 family)